MGRDSLFSLLREQNLLIKQRVHRTRTTYSDHGLRVYPDLRKDFEPTGINQLWVADITYIWLGKEEGFHYLFLITDAYSKKVLLHPKPLRELQDHTCISQNLSGF
ncbi:MAG: hypothetical protein K2O49_09255 [Muribaculaceae bacterium]|nr:hypothetical protein [Muribaculaceae bacterium]